jgi:hypothetical protein
MKTLLVPVLASMLLVQSDPLAAAKKDLGAGFAVERVEPGILLATPGEESDGGALRDSIRKAVKTFRARALDVAPQDSLMIILFGSAESYRAYTAKRYPGPVPQTTYYDVPNRRVLLRTETAAAYALQVARIFLLADSLNGGTLPPWIASSLSVLDEPDPEPPTFDHRAALLREALRRGTLPPLKTYFAMDLQTFHGRDVLSLHTSVALKFAEYLEKRGALKKFFEQYRRTFRKDDGGVAAVEAALGLKLEAVEKDFAAHLKVLPWLNQERFLDQAKKVFGPSPLIQVDEDLMMAVTGNVEPRVAAQALDQVRKLREPLIRLFDLKTSGLPVLARLFKDAAAFQDYAKIDAPHRQWVGGYFSYDSRWLVLHLEPDSGSLAHEYCHSLFEDDLGRLPPWFSEGLACLFQQVRLEGGVPVGERGSVLRSVRTGMGQNRVANLSEFVNMKGLEFFDGERVNLSYDVSHALLLFLQDKGALVPMVKEVKRAKAATPFALPIATCRAALEKAMGAKMDKINDDFRAWVTATKD